MNNKEFKREIKEGVMSHLISLYEYVKLYNDDIIRFI